jgi:hypothetical protein
MILRILISLLVLLLAFATLAPAQNFSGDARMIGLGGVGHDDSIATRMIEEERPYTSILLPIGLIQLLRDRDRFDPDKDNFDPVLLMEYAANPVHYVFGRNPGGNRGAFLEDILNGELNRDLNAYRGFVPRNKLMAEGLASPNWGKTIKFRKRDSGVFQGVYVGAGPYVSARTELNIDKGLTDILASPTPVPIPNRSFSITDASVGQLALAITGGYRARFALPGRSAFSSSNREGIYVGANYHHLRGFRYQAADMLFRFDTDSSGKLSIQPSTVPAVVNYVDGRSGRGFALDLGVGAVADRWEFGFGANGVGNRIEWKEQRLKRYTLDSLVNSDGEFTDVTLPPPASKLIVELPVQYTGSASFRQGGWTALSEASHGFQGWNYHGGVERRFAVIEVRGGGRYSRDRWHPSCGIGFNLTERFSIDAAAFSTSANIEGRRRLALAVSLRFNRVN